MTDTIAVAGADIKIHSLTDGQMTALYRVYELAQTGTLDGHVLVKEMMRCERIILACIINQSDREFVGDKLETGEVTLAGIMKQIFDFTKAENDKANEPEPAPVRRPRGRPRKSAAQ